MLPWRWGFGTPACDNWSIWTLRWRGGKSVKWATAVSQSRGDEDRQWEDKRECSAVWCLWTVISSSLSLCPEHLHFLYSCLCSLNASYRRINSRLLQIYTQISLFFLLLPFSIIYIPCFFITVVCCIHCIKNLNMLRVESTWDKEQCLKLHLHTHTGGFSYHWLIWPLVRLKLVGVFHLAYTVITVMLSGQTNNKEGSSVSTHVRDREQSFKASLRVHPSCNL